MTALEREARKLRDIWLGTGKRNAEPFAKSRNRLCWLALARHVLAERRRAAGKTVGYVGVSHGRTVCHRLLLTKCEAEDDFDAVSGSYRVARVVAVPKKGKVRR